VIDPEARARINALAFVVIVLAIVAVADHWRPAPWAAIGGYVLKHPPTSEYGFGGTT
jgi:hypothetical protein